jgi:archaeal flagellar protein FlaI
MLFKEGAPLYAQEVERRQGQQVLYINYLQAPYVPSLADAPGVLGRTITALIEHPDVAAIVFVQQRLYHYPSSQILLLAEIARLYTFFVRDEDLLSLHTLQAYGDAPTLYGELRFLLALLQQDPYRCYRELGKKIRALQGTGQASTTLYERIRARLEQTALIKRGLHEGILASASLYRLVFRPDVLPNFTFTRLITQFPPGARLVDQYTLEVAGESATVTLLQHPGDGKHLYHIVPPEYALSEEHYLLLSLARGVLTEHRPKAEEFTDPEKTRGVFLHVARDLLSELARSKHITLSYAELLSLSRILVRHTIGFGILEVLLWDARLQDIVLNAPVAQNPIFVRHERFDECSTNLVPNYEDADSWAAKLRLQSGRPLDEANPILDTDLVFGTFRARVAAITEPLSPAGLAFALRRHRDDPWTLPLFIQRKMLTPFAAGLLSFLIDGNRTLLVAGTRSSGKTSLLGSLLLEIAPTCRTLVVEDTLELPVDALRTIGYDVLRMKVRSALVSGSTEVEAAEGIRTSLRLGDSALIVGEVRSTEARALYEAMRVGALANVVAGTIHGDSPYGVFDRVVHDLGVPPTSFKATDIIIVTNPISSLDGTKIGRRILQVTEVRKHWREDPAREGGFVDLLRYNVETDQLEPTPALLQGDSEVLKAIASRIKGFAGNWDAVWDALVLRGMMKEELVRVAEKYARPDLLEAPFCTRANQAFRRIATAVAGEHGLPLTEEVFPRWSSWLTASLTE